MKTVEKKRRNVVSEVESSDRTAGLPLPHWPPLLPHRPVSGLYEWHLSIPLASSAISTEAVDHENGDGNGDQVSLPSIPLLAKREELRLDVDGPYPQMVASGLRYGIGFPQTHWIANLKATGLGIYTGSIWYKDGGSFPYTNVEIRVVSAFFFRQATLKFSGVGLPRITRTFKYKSGYFHALELEFDAADGTAAVTSFPTHSHPNRPSSIPDETLTLETVFRRAGFEVKKSNGDGIVPMVGAGPNALWSDAEMHDAMQTYWSRFANAPQWGLWTFFASLHEMGTGLGGIMFDQIGPNHRQGTAIFEDAFIKNPPANEPAPDAWVQRMRFWTATHEMGHCFNLAHSWQKSLGTPWGALPDEPEVRSFMNYPYRVSGGQTAFFADFEYRFSDPELLFMRHAPPRFVQMGNADWFDHHGFQQAAVSLEPAYRLEVRVNRPKPTFEFLEPVVLELKVTNISGQPQLVPEKLLASPEHMTVIIKRRGHPARQFMPFSQHCWQHVIRVLEPGDSIYESLFVSAGNNGWDIAEPGYYSVQLALDLEGEEIVSNSIVLRIEPPRGYDEEYLAQDFFTDAVGRVLAFDGSRFLAQANNTLMEVSERLADRRVALHAKIALGNPSVRSFKQLQLPTEERRSAVAASKAGGKIATSAADLKGARQQLTAALLDRPEVSAESLGHVDFKYYMERFADCLDEQQLSKDAVKVQDVLYQTLATRKVLDRVLRDVKKRRESYRS